MQPHMVICGSSYRCASLTKHDMWRTVAVILEILPIPQHLGEDEKRTDPDFKRVLTKPHHVSLLNGSEPTFPPRRTRTPGC